MGIKEYQYHEEIIHNKKTNRNIIVRYPIEYDLNEAEKHNKQIAKEVFQILTMVKI